jgi:hypothetical protein
MKETLEQAAEKEFPLLNTQWCKTGAAEEENLELLGHRKSFINGAKWQAERNYFEAIEFAEWIIVKDFQTARNDRWIGLDMQYYTTKELFEQFKKTNIMTQEEPKIVTVDIKSALGEDLIKVSYIPWPGVDYVLKEEPKQEYELKDFESSGILDILNMGNVTYLSNGDIIYFPNLLFIKRDDKWFIKTELPKQETLEELKQDKKTACECKRAYTNPLSGICSLCWNEKFPNEKDEIKEEDLLEYKQETLEQAAAKHFNEEIFVEGVTIQYALQEAFIIGAKWRAERMYSEEEVEQIARFGFNAGKRVELRAVDLDFTFEKWFEQFKKK